MAHQRRDHETTELRLIQKRILSGERHTNTGVQFAVHTSFKHAAFAPDGHRIRAYPM